MKSRRLITTCIANAALAVAIAYTPLPASAAPFAGDDFDGGLAYLTRTITPDNSATFGNFENPTDGNGNSGHFDIYGIINGGSMVEDGMDSFIPFDLRDESTSDPTDSLGILRSTDTDKVFAVADLENPTNTAGTGMAQWTFDITGRTNIELSIDMAMLGDFESSDTFEFTYSIDGGGAQTAFDITADEDGSYVPMLESGNDYSTNFFFDEGAWLELVFGGGPGAQPNGDVLAFDPDDADMDGYVEVTLNGSPTQVRTYEITLDPEGEPSTFVNPELEPLETINDPLALDGGEGVQLTNVLTPYTVAIAGTGSTLTLNFAAAQNAGSEFFVFDDIELSEGDAPAVTPGDYNGDGFVNALDYAVWRENVGGTLPFNETDNPGTVDAGDFQVWLNNYTGEVAAAAFAPAPEPTTAGLMLAACCCGTLLRRRK